jgi:transposase-like protein
MSKDNRVPATLIEAVRYFSDEEKAIQFLAQIRWPEGEQVCHKCGSVGEHYWLKAQKRWKCRDCRKQFSIKVGTIFEDSPVKLTKWLPAVWLMVNCKNGISSYEVARDLGVTQKTAWFMMHRIRLALRSGSFDKMNGEIEADETYIGGVAKNMHRAKRERVIRGTGGMDKTAVMGLLERPRGAEHSLVRTMVLDETTKARMQGHIREHVGPGASVYTDAHTGYRGLSKAYMHGVVDHAAEYVRGKVHTNGLENFWSLVKRAIHGTYVSIEPFHVFRYLDEQTFRFNNRGTDDASRFVRALRGIAEKRLTYAELTGKEMCVS